MVYRIYSQEFSTKLSLLTSVCLIMLYIVFNVLSPNCPPPLIIGFWTFRLDIAIVYIMVSMGRIKAC